MVGFDELTDQIRHRRAMAEPPLVVAIDGRSAAGKSTLAAALAPALDATVVHMDDFYRVMDPAERERLTPSEGAARYFDWQRVRDEALVPLRRGQEAQFRPFDWTNDAYGTFTTITPVPTIVVEGVYSARPELRDLVDFVVLVETHDATRRVRRDERAHDLEAWKLRWDLAEDFYFETLFDHSTVDAFVDGAAARG